MLELGKRVKYMVRQSMIFYNFNDFYRHCDYIKKQYVLLSTYDKIVYKMYVYSNRILSEKLANIIWEYLNEPFGSVYYVNKRMLKEYLG